MYKNIIKFFIIVGLFTFASLTYGVSTEVMDSPDDYVKASKVGEVKALSNKVKSNNQVGEESMDSPKDYVKASKVGEMKALSKKVKSNNQVSEQSIDSPKEAARTAAKEQKKITTSQKKRVRR